MQNKNVFITGGTGLLGNSILTQLINDGYNCSAISRSKKNPEGPVNWIQADLLDPSAYDQELRGKNTIIHAAGLISYLASDKQKLFQSNFMATRDLVNAAIYHGVEKLIYISSASTLLRSSNPLNISVHSKGTPVFNSQYARSKFLAELEIWRAEAEGMKVCILHPSLIIGYGNWTKGSMNIFQHVLDGLKYYPPGQTGIVSADDVAKIISRICKHEIFGKSILVNAEVWSYKNLLNEIAFQLAKPAISKKASPWMATMMACTETLKSFINFKNVLITKETIKSSFSQFSYDTDTMADYHYEDIKTLIGKIIINQNSSKFY